MRTAERAAESWPETLALPPERLHDDPAAGSEAIEVAVARSQRLELSAPLRLGADPSHDLTTLRFLTEAAERLAELDWTLAGEPPWPVRTLVHLPPPRDGAAGATDYAARWREDHRYGLCTYRIGPGFVRIRDVRPGGRHLRVLVEGAWADVFAEVLTAGSDEGRGRQLLDDLTAAGLAVHVGVGTHVLPFRLRRWPIPYTSV